MKKDNLNFPIILAASLLLIINSCKKDDSNATNCVSAPVVTTAFISNTNETSATGGGTVHYGENVESRGICWSTSPHPTIDLATKTSDGTGIGGFSSNITGLTPLTLYYVRAYSTNCAGTSYGTEVYFNSSVFIGNHYQGGIIAYVFQPGEPGYKANVPHGLIAASSDLGSAEWGCLDSLLSGAADTLMLGGNQNTINIIKGCSDPGIAALICHDLVSNGYSDWFLASRDELNKLYINRDAIGGFDNSATYWSSSQYDKLNARTQDWSSGGWGSASKNTSLHVRAVRYF